MEVSGGVNRGPASAAHPVMKFATSIASMGLLLLRLLELLLLPLWLLGAARR